MNEYISGQNLNGLKKFNLNNCFKDPSFLREKLALDFCQEHGLAAPRCAYSKVYINGTYWGLYTFVEETDNGNFLNQRFGNKQGNMFKGDPNGDLRWYGSLATSYYPKYELHTNETVNDWSDLVNFIDKINNSGVNFYDSLEQVLNTNTFINHWGIMNLFVNLDSYIGSGHNYFIYHDTLSNKFEWVTWDVNESCGTFTMGLTPTQIKNLSLFYTSTPSSNRPLVQKMLANSTYKNGLIYTVCNWVQYDFSNAALDPKIDSLANAIRADVYADTKKFYTNTQFEDNLTMDLAIPNPGGGMDNILGIKPFITARRNSLIAELFANGCYVGVNESQKDEDQILIYPNPTSDYIYIDIKSKEKENTIHIYNAFGQVLSVIVSENQIEKIDVSKFSAGIYIIKVNGRNYSKFQKVD
jgi:hypothetical protein